MAIDLTITATDAKHTLPLPPTQPFNASATVEPGVGGLGMAMAVFVSDHGTHAAVGECLCIALLASRTCTGSVVHFVGIITLINPIDVATDFHQTWSTRDQSFASDSFTMLQ